MLAEEKLVVMPIYKLSIEANTENGSTEHTILTNSQCLLLTVSITDIWPTLLLVIYYQITKLA